MTRRFTGYHITAILVAFFGLIIAVNLVMAHAATRTFGGLLAKNGYVASRDYNRWIAASAAQDRLGWLLHYTVEKGHLVIALEGPANPEVRVIAEHPLGRKQPSPIRMVRMSDGRFQSALPVAEGRWKLRISIRENKNEARFLREMIV